MSRSGLVCIGTNSTRALVADFTEDRSANVLLRRTTGTRIGQGLKERGALEPEAVRRTLEAIDGPMNAVRKLTRHVRAIATSALRRAENAADFARAVERIVGAPLQTISGDEEARSSYEGAVWGLRTETPEARFGVADVGGGSTEFAAGTSEGAKELASLEIGAVRLTEAVPELAGAQAPVPENALDSARELARRALDPARGFAPVDRLVLVGGSATTIARALLDGRNTFEYAPLRRVSLQGFAERLAAMALEARRSMPGVDPQRADILLAGALILDELFDIAERAEATVSVNDLLLGYLLRHRGKEAA